MPYIKDADRHLELLPEDVAVDAGQLNYQITNCVLGYLELKGLKYQTLAEIEGVLGHVAKELYRRTAVPYEDKKIAENGDVDGFV